MPETLPMTKATVRPYGSRNFAVYRGPELVCVTVYKKGAFRVAELLNLGVKLNLVPDLEIPNPETNNA